MAEIKNTKDKEKFYQRIGCLIGKARSDKGLTLEELAKSADASRQAISLWEKGERAIPAYNLSRIVKTLNLCESIMFTSDVKRKS